MTTFRYLSLVPFLIIAACGDNAAPPGGGSSSGGSSSSSSGNVPQDGGADVIPAASISLAIADATVIQGSTVELTLELTRGASVTGDVGVKFATLPLGLGLPVGDLVFKAGQSTLKVQLSAGIDGKQGDAKLSATATTLDGATSSKKDFTVLVRGAPGTLDKTFGVDGTLKLPTIGILSRLEVLADGSAFVAGPDYEDGSLRVVKVKPDGTVDTAYGMAGAAAGDITDNDVSDNIVVRPDGSVLVSGKLKGTGAARAFRFGPTGTFDLGFGAVDDARSADARTSVVATSQYLYLASSAGNDTYMTRYSFAGVRDTTYPLFVGYTNLGAMTLGSDGLVTMCGSDNANATFDVARLNAAGTPDNTINLPVTPAGVYRRCFAIAARKAGGVFLGLNSGLSARSTQTAMIAATKSALQLDTTFGSAGAFAVGEGRVTGITEDASQRPVAVVTGSTGSRVVRLTAAGAFDTSFGAGGSSAAATGDSYVNAKVLPNARILVVGIRSDDSSRLYRLWN